MIRLLVSVVIASLCMTGASGEPMVLEVSGRHVEGGPGYDGGGAVRLIDAEVAAQVVHYDGSEEFRLPLAIEYEVVETAPIVLNSRLGTEHYELYHFGNARTVPLYVREQIDLSRPGRRIAIPRNGRAWFDADRDALPERGIVGIRGHRYFLIDPAEGGDWLDITDPPGFFLQREVDRELTFTLADLSGEYSVRLSDFQSTWEPGGPVRVSVTVTDSRGDTFPVVNAPLTMTAGGETGELATQWTPLQEPTGWLVGALPEGDVPNEVAIAGPVTLLTPDGPRIVHLSESWDRGTGRLAAEEMEIAMLGWELPETADGRVRETRGLWIATGDVLDRAGIDTAVERSERANLNMVIPDVFYRNTFLGHSDLMPISDRVEEGLDPIAYMTEACHQRGLEMHPWFCISYRSPQFNEWFEETYGTDVRMYDESGERVELAVDVHRPEYRDFVVDLMVGVARDYDVDGIHLDYIRTKGRCFCDACRAEFAEQFGKPLTEATDEEWIEWQRQAIGDIVRRTAEGVAEVNPDAIISAAVFAGLHGGAMQGQDPAGWARQGWVDVVIPMDYSTSTLAIRANERQFLEALDDDDALATGLSLYMGRGETTHSRPASLVAEQINLVRSMGIHGYVLFSADHLSDDQIEMLREDVNARDAVPFYR